MADGSAQLESRFVACRGRRIHFLRSVTPTPPGRPAVVLVHGLASCRYMVPLGQELAPHVQVYAPDLPGFGESDAPPERLHVEMLADAMAEWMAAAGLDQAVHVGNSLGCCREAG